MRVFIVLVWWVGLTSGSMALAQVEVPTSEECAREESLSQPSPDVFKEEPYAEVSDWESRLNPYRD